MPIESYSLSELLEAIRLSLRGSFPDSYWVRAEISSLSVRANGHCYMEFAEGPASTPPSAFRGMGEQQYTAKIKVNCWRTTWTTVSRLFEAAAGQPLRTGMQVLAEVTVEFHPIYGMSLTVLQIDPSFTLGDLAKKKEETLRRLEAEGVIDMQKALTLVRLPKRIAVISSATAAGYQDFLDQLLHNAAAYAFRVTLFEAIMQGDTAAASVIRALEAIYEREQEFDAVVIIRGGGATTDLTAFDQYELAAVCANFPLPIIAGIGHTRDVSVVDRVAYLSVKTPTAAAAFFIDTMATEDALITALAERLRLTATKQIQLRKQHLDTAKMQLRLLLNQRIQQQHHQLALAEKTIELHSPERIFRMGYSLTMKDGEIVRDAHQLQAGDTITTVLSNGTVESVVE